MATKSIYAGFPQIIYGSNYSYGNNSNIPLYIDWGNGISNNTCYLFTTTATIDIAGSSSYVWQLVSNNPSNFAPTWSQQGNNLSFYFWATQTQNARFKINGYNGCGSSPSYFVNFDNINCGPSGNPCNTLFKVSPNPSNGLITIVTERPAPCNFQNGTAFKADAEIVMESIRLIDQAGNIKLNTKPNASKLVTQTIQLPNSLINGVYVLEIQYNYGVEKQQIIIQH